MIYFVNHSFECVQLLCAARSLTELEEVVWYTLIYDTTQWKTYGGIPVCGYDYLLLSNKAPKMVYMYIPYNKIYTGTI